MTTVSTYQDLKGKVHTGDFLLERIVNNIRCNPNKDVIERLRTLDRQDPDFNAIKETLPIFTPHTTLHLGQKADKRVKDLTGLIYIDLDGADSSEQADRLMLQDETVMAFKSVSGRGYGILIRYELEGISLNVFRSAIKNYLDCVGVDYDKNALGLSRGCIVSSDEDVYYNPNASAIDLLKYNQECKENKKVSFSPLFPKGEGIKRANDTFFVNFETKLSDASYGDQAYVVIPEGLGYTRTHLNGIVDGNRHKKVAIMVAGIIYNNPEIGFAQLLKWVSTINHTWIRKICTPLSDVEVYNLVKWAHDRHTAGELDYTPSRLKKVWFKDDCGLSGKEKQSVAAKEIGKIRRSNTQQKIYDAVEAMQGGPVKITAKSVAAEIGLSLITVKRYWPEIKEYVKELNGK